MHKTSFVHSRQHNLKVELYNAVATTQHNLEVDLLCYAFNDMSLSFTMLDVMMYNSMIAKFFFAYIFFNYLR